MMSDLPTRYDAAVYVRSTFSKDNDALIPAIMRAYADGRLIDHNKIDYEAAVQAWLRIYRSLLGEPLDLPGFVMEATVEMIVDAALGIGGDE